MSNTITTKRYDMWDSSLSRSVGWSSNPLTNRMNKYQPETHPSTPPPLDHPEAMHTTNKHYLQSLMPWQNWEVVTFTLCTAEPSYVPLCSKRYRPHLWKRLHPTDPYQSLQRTRVSDRLDRAKLSSFKCSHAGMCHEHNCRGTKTNIPWFKARAGA